MSWSSIAPSILLRSSEVPAKPDSIARAEQLMDLIKSPTAVATLILIAFAKSQLDKNASAQYDTSRTVFATAASAGAVVITAIVAAVMLPLSIRVLWTRRWKVHDIDTTLLVYTLTHLVAIGTMVYATVILIQCVRELKAG